MFFEWGNEAKVWESCTSYAIIRVITVRVMQSLRYFCRVGRRWLNDVSVGTLSVSARITGPGASIHPCVYQESVTWWCIMDLMMYRSTLFMLSKISLCSIIHAQVTRHASR